MTPRIATPATIVFDFPKRDLIETLNYLATQSDFHVQANELFLGYIGDPDVRAAYDQIEKRYA